MRTTLILDWGNRTLSLSTPVYESIKEFILSTLSEKGEVTFVSLLEEAEQSNLVQFEGDNGWCFLAVKRDLEARGLIKVTIGLGKNRAQVISLNKKNTSTLALSGG